MFVEDNQINNKFEKYVPDAEYGAIRGFLNRSCGIVLSEEQRTLLHGRMLPIMNRFGLDSFAGLVAALQSPLPSTRELRAAVIDAMTTKETAWFRQGSQFQLLNNLVLPELMRMQNDSIRIWSAGCSFGQEPYSISMSAADLVRSYGKGKDYGIVGTDISEKVLACAADAVYADASVSGYIADTDRQRFFLPVSGGYRLNAEIRRPVSFQQVNLLKPFSALGRFQLIVCRNVLIYFSDEIRRDILTRMAGSLASGGYLMLGETESLPDGLGHFDAVDAAMSCYRKAG